MENANLTDEEVASVYEGKTLLITLLSGHALRARKIGHRVVLDIIPQGSYTQVTRRSPVEGRPLAGSQPV